MLFRHAAGNQREGVFHSCRNRYGETGDKEGLTLYGDGLSIGEHALDMELDRLGDLLPGFIDRLAKGVTSG